MDLANVSILNDNKLVELYRNPNTPEELKKSILKELENRAIEEENTYQTDENSLTKNQKITLLLTPFLMKYHRTGMFKNGWSRKKDKAFWYYITFGFAIYIALLFCIVMATYKH